MTLYYNNIVTPLFLLHIFADDDAVIRLTINKVPQHAGYTVAEVIENDVIKQAVRELSEYMDGSRHSFSVPVKPKGTEFQMLVWKTLQEIPYGVTLSYSGLAERMGNKSWTRAAGGALGANPIPVIIPCHRVISADGTPGGFSADGGGEHGVEIKKRLLELERGGGLFNETGF